MRLALGATPSRIGMETGKQVALLLGLASAIAGGAGVWLLAPLVRIIPEVASVDGLQPTRALEATLGVVIVVAVALAAAFGALRRALRVEPKSLVQ